MPTEQKDIVTFDDWTTGPWHSLGSDHGPKKGYFYDCVICSCMRMVLWVLGLV